MSGTSSSRRHRLVFGIGPVTELLANRSRDIAILYLYQPRLNHKSDKPARKPKRRNTPDALGEIAQDAGRRGVSIEFRTRDELDALLRHHRLDGGNGQHKHPQHQGAVAVVGPYPYVDVDDLLAAAEAGPGPALLVALDSVQDPHNLGAIVRSAHVLGAHGVIVPRDRASGVTATVTKVSAGATEHLAIAQVTNLARTLAELRDAGLWRVALAAGKDTTPLYELDASLPLCLVLGAEGSGIRPLVARHCDFHCEIPMSPTSGVGSLNVSVAAGIALYEIVRQRTRLPPASQS